MRTRVKICGITCAEDGLAAARAGADAIGFVFARRSKRLVTASAAKDVSRALAPWMHTVGVFEEQSAEEIAAIADAVGLGAVQLHGDHGPEVAAALKRFRVIRAVRLGPAGFSSELAQWHDALRRGEVPNLAAILLDGPSPGSGQENDLPAVQAAMRSDLARAVPTIIAGGLRPENIARVVRIVRPWAVDVSSGVESAPGRKDPAKLESLMREIAAADAG